VQQVVIVSRRSQLEGRRHGLDASSGYPASQGMIVATVDVTQETQSNLRSMQATGNARGWKATSTSVI
jgi:hypothetical protein